MNKLRGGVPQDMFQIQRTAADKEAERKWTAAIDEYVRNTISKHSEKLL